MLPGESVFSRANSCLPHSPRGTFPGEAFFRVGIPPGEKCCPRRNETKPRAPPWEVVSRGRLDFSPGENFFYPGGSGYSTPGERGLPRGHEMLPRGIRGSNLPRGDLTAPGGPLPGEDLPFGWPSPGRVRLPPGGTRPSPEGLFGSRIPGGDVESLPGQACFTPGEI